MATTSQKMMLSAGSQQELTFSSECGYRPDEILGSYTGCADTTAEDGRAGDKDPPARLYRPMSPKRARIEGDKCTHHPAPRTLSPMQRPMPVDAHMYGLDSSRNRPTLNASPEPARGLTVVLTEKGATARTGEEKIKCDEYRQKGWETECVIEEEVTHVVWCCMARSCTGSPVYARTRDSYVPSPQRPPRISH